MRTPRAAALAALLGFLGALLTVTGSPARADGTTTELSLVRPRPHYPAVFHDNVNGSLPGVDYIEYQATLTASDPSAQPDVANQQVVLERMLTGQSRWHDVGFGMTDSNGNVDYSTPVSGNAYYRVTYGGSTALQPATSQSLRLRAMRDFNTQLIQTSRGVFLQGDINPGWGHRLVSWQLRTCRTCRWRTLTTARASRTGAWRFQGGWARDGRTLWFRAKLDKTADFITSTSTMLKTKPAGSGVRQPIGATW